MNDIHTNKVQHEFAENCLRNHIPKFVNNLDETIKNKFLTHSLPSILRFFKDLRLKTYNFICADKHCYSCNPPTPDSISDAETYDDSSEDSFID